jgi:ribosome biogenesis GTPase
LKRGPREEDIAAIGDWVQVTPVDESSGMIEAVDERNKALVRKAPTPRGEYMQIIVANPDQAVFIFACAQPAPRFGMLDRFLVIAEQQEIPAVIVANKIDLVGIDAAKALFGIYTQIGYPVIYSSAKSGAGLAELRETIAGKISVFSGPSGAGKSSLLNALQPGLGLEVRKVSEATSKGRHTTVVRELFSLQGGGYVADTPGIKALALWDMEPEELDGYFPEMRDLILDCEFNNCTHMDEFNCAIQAAVEQGQIPVSRYQSYVRMRTGQEEDLEY